MSMSRNLVIDLLIQNLISNDTIIYTKKDRAFLYSKIFKIIIYVEDIDRDKLVEHCNSKFNKSFKIFEMLSIIQWPTNFLALYGKWPSYLHDLTISKDNMLNYKRTNYYNKYDNPDFLNLVGEIEYLKDLPGFVENKYIAVHFRQKTCEYGVKWNNKYIDLDIIIQDIDYQIVVFSGNIENLIQKYNNNPKLYLTSNLQEYMSLLKNHNCLALNIALVRWRSNWLILYESKSQDNNVFLSYTIIL